MRTVLIHASPPPVPCAPCDGAGQDIVGDAYLSRCRAQQWTDCSVLGAQSMHAGGGHNGLDGLQLNVSIASKAANARAGQEYQVPVRGHQLRALGTPVQAVLVPSVHAVVHWLAHDRGAPECTSNTSTMSRPMSCAAAGCWMGPRCVYGAQGTGCKGLSRVYFDAQRAMRSHSKRQPCNYSGLRRAQISARGDR